MYSVVLMAALTTGSATPAWGLLGCHGCWGGCHGGWGGCRGGYGGCWGGGCYGGGYGCYGGGYACYGGYGGCYGWTGGGCYGCYGGWTGVSNYAPTPRRPVDKLPPPKPAEEGKETSVDSRARVIVELPGDAKLYVDDQLMKSAAKPRVFKTPSLEQGETYYYILRAEVIRDGNTRSERKRVLVQAGQDVRVSFPELESVATTRAEAKTKH